MSKRWPLWNYLKDNLIQVILGVLGSIFLTPGVIFSIILYISYNFHIYVLSISPIPIST